MPRKSARITQKRIFRAIDQGSSLSFSHLLPQMIKANFSGIIHLGCPLIIFAGAL